MKDLAEAVKRGVWQAGEMALEFPTISLGEIYLNPTSMLYRNLAAMDTEEMIRAQPIDGVVLHVNCDKTIPAALMGAASADLPAILVSGGPMLNGNYRRQILGTCTDWRRLTAEHQAGTLDTATYKEIEDGIMRSTGHGMVMGTASTMNSLTEALGHCFAPQRCDSCARCAPLAARRSIWTAHRYTGARMGSTLADYDARRV